MEIDFLHLQEGRKVEFKEALPPGKKIAKTIVAFSNGSGGDIYIGIEDKTRKIVGIPEEEIFTLEEQIMNIVFDCCYPNIIPDIKTFIIEEKHILNIKVYPGSLLPYYIKQDGKNNGTYIRVGSTNRIAGQENIAELERKKRNITFDSIPMVEMKEFVNSLSSFIQNYTEKTGKKIDIETLKKLGLIAKVADQYFYTAAAVLLSNSENKISYFPYAKIECAHFKGKGYTYTIDSRTIDGPISLQADEAMIFIKNNIKKSSSQGEIYRIEKWEYPLTAIRELVINAIIHRDYSISGQDIKIAIDDEMFEITSPGVFPANIDLSILKSGQSEIRNKVLAPIFKELKLIEQWGTGFQKLYAELEDYPNLEVKINEPGLAFQIQLVKKEPAINTYGFMVAEQIVPYGVSKMVDQPIQKQVYNTPETTFVAAPKFPYEDAYKFILNSAHALSILNYCKEYKSGIEIKGLLGLADRAYFTKNILKPLVELHCMGLLFPDKPRSSKQKYITTAFGKQMLDVFIERVNIFKK